MRQLVKFVIQEVSMEKSFKSKLLSEGVNTIKVLEEEEVFTLETFKVSHLEALAKPAVKIGQHAILYQIWEQSFTSEVIWEQSFTSEVTFFKHVV